MAEDRELVERLCQGDRDALQRIYVKYKDDLLTIASCMLARRADAEDCLHDVIVSLVTGSVRIRRDGNLKGYLVTAIANRARDLLRKRSRRNPAGETAGRTTDEIVGKAANPAAAMTVREESQRLHTAIAALPPEQRTVITLHLHGEMTFQEIAQQEGVSNNTIRSRYRYGLDKLRSSLGVGVEQ